MSDDGPLVGREDELRALENALSGERPGLVLCTGGPRTGKRRILQALRARAGAYPCALVPDDGSPEGWLACDKETSIEEFRLAIEQPNAARVAATDFDRPRDFDLILVYGYRPEEDFHEWFVGELLPSLRTAKPPRVLVLAGNSGDVQELKPHAETEVALGPLPREAVVAELRAINSSIDDPMDDDELTAYADAVTTEPSLIGALRHVLPLTSARPSAPVEG